ncbi:zinc-binding dehydrogenase [Variovorax sp. RCC_210]|uniref:zinc-binding dehydrogenase n=1 Tax=Variovorax sp. RCC_210 TaxID=3239217 RepID=UPI003525C239
MKAAILQERGRNGLRVRDVPMPVRRPGEVLLRVHAAALNRVDLYMRDNGAGITHRLPQTLGVEAAGVVVEADADSGLEIGLHPGKKAVVYANAFCGKCRYCLAGDQPLCLHAHIMGEHRDGGFAEYVAMPARCVLPLPDHVDLVEAGALLAAYLTAWRMLFGKRALRPGETVLIAGVGGGVAVACLQLALHAGARVLVTSSSDDKLARAQAMGASGGVNYRREKVAKRVLEMTSGEGVDMVIDSSGAASWDDSLRSLRRGGRLVTCGATTGSNPPADLQRIFIRQLEVYGSTGGSVAECHQLLALFASGAIRPVIDRRFVLDDIGAAFDQLEHGNQFGKVVVTMA